MGAIQHIVISAANLNISRFGPEHIDTVEGLAAAAVAVIMAYPKPAWKLESSFLKSLQGQIKGGKMMSDKQLAGAANTALLINKRVLKEQEQPVKEQPAAKQPKQEQATSLPPRKGYEVVKVKAHARYKKVASPRQYWTGKAS